MTDNIRNVWDGLSPEFQKEGENAVMEYFGLTSTISFRQNWIYKGLIPESKQEKTLDILQRTMKKQIDGLNRLVGE